MNNLSKENYDKLNENYLYQCEPVINNSYYIGNISATYHCKNWTFKVHRYEDGRVYMQDTYFNDWEGSTQVTDENIDNYKFVFDFKKVKRLHDSESNEYDEKDLYHVATDSGGYSCGGTYWVDKDTKKSKQLLINKKKSEISGYESDLKWAKRELEKLLNEEG